MATISLYAGKISQMKPLANDLKKSVTSLKAELTSLRDTVLKNSTTTCDLGPQAARLSGVIADQEAKIASIESFVRNCENFADETARTDNDVAELINSRKNEFYSSYPYLKPESEFGFFDHAQRLFSNAAEWCKEHWVTLVTILVVIAVAVLAVVTFGLAVAAVAAIAGLISLALCVGDLVCLGLTGMGLSDFFRSKGWNVLADIFDGVSIGCDIVSIALPVGAALKSMAKVGVKAFTKATIQAVKASFKETIEQVFKKGFKEGVKNAGKILFKTFVFDIDDFTTMRNGKRVFDLREPTLIPNDKLNPRKYWTKEGDQLIPSTSLGPKTGSRSFNPEGLTMAELMDAHGLDFMPVGRNGNPVDLRSISVDSVNIKGFSDLRTTTNGVMGNFEKADAALMALRGVDLKGLSDQLGVRLTWHDDINMRTMHAVFSDIHQNLRHYGGISNFKFITGRIPDQLNSLVQNMARYLVRNKTPLAGTQTTP